MGSRMLERRGRKGISSELVAGVLVRKGPDDCGQ
jgi:hypothetical protein